MLEKMHLDELKEAETIVRMLVIGRVCSTLAHSNKGYVRLALAAMIMPPPVTAANSRNKEDKEEPPREKLWTVISKKKKEGNVNKLQDRHLLKLDLTNLEKIECMKSFMKRRTNGEVDRWG
jgi:hypothetical protein